MTTAQMETRTCVESGSLAKLEYRTQGFCWGWRSFGALVGLVGGLVAALIGSVLTAISWFVEITGIGVGVQALGTDFLLLTIPLLVLGAHCLDLGEKEDGKGRKPQINGNS